MSTVRMRGNALKGVVDALCLLPSSAHMADIRRRIGSSVCVFEEKLYRWRGDSDIRPNINQLEVFDFKSGQWSVESVQAIKGSTYPRACIGSASANVGSTMYVFGGFASVFNLTEAYHCELYKIDLRTYELELVMPKNPFEGPMEKYLCGMVGVGRNKLLVFGGFGKKSHSRLQPGASYGWSDEFRAMWTNEAHVFDLRAQEWSDLKAGGIPPPPCAAFSFTRIDQDRVALFAGRQVEARVNHVYVLDMATWTWSHASEQMYPSAPWPDIRSLHTAVCLVEPSSIPGPNQAAGSGRHRGASSAAEQKLLVLWGQDREGDQLSDCWVLSLKDFGWEKISLPNSLDGRKWHSSAAFYPTPGEAIIVTTGGFKKDESDWSCPNFEDTFIIRSGVCSLYNLCLKWITRQVPALSTSVLARYLPKHIISDLQRYCEAEIGFDQFVSFKV